MSKENKMPQSVICITHISFTNDGDEKPCHLTTFSRK